ncbi:MAG: hypothetical protein ACHQ5A_14070, partial [Opitutales bacterium]
AVRRPPALAGLWAASFLGLMLVAGFSFWQAWPVLAPVAESLGLIRPVLVVQAPQSGAKPGGAAGSKAKGAPESHLLYEEMNDGFGRRQRGPLIAWDLPPPKQAAPLQVRRVESANPQQAAFALVSGELLLEAYPRKNLKLILAVRVPVRGDVGLVLYDSEHRKLVDERLFLLSEAPRARTWYQVDNLQVVYLGEPTGLPLQNSLAMR